MNSGQSLTIKLVDTRGEGVPGEGVLIDIHFFQKGQFRYAFSAGNTDAQGQTTVTYENIERQRTQQAALFLMDYNSKLDDCDARVQLVVPTDEQLKEAQRNVRRYYGKDPDWASVWPTNHKVMARPVFVELLGPNITVAIPCVLTE